VRQDVHSSGFIGRAPQPSPRCCGRFGRRTRKCEESNAGRQGCNGAVSFERRNGGALEDSGVAPEGERFATACYDGEAAGGLTSADGAASR